MKKISVILRYDDFNATSDIMLEEELMDLFRKYEISCLVGIVPFADKRAYIGPDSSPLCGAKATLLRKGIEDGVVEPALHGYTHFCRPRTDREGNTEFQGLSGKQQWQMMKDGKGWLEDITGQAIQVFIPPYNSYDKETVQVMRQVGLTILSGAMFDRAPHGQGISFVPHTCRLQQLRKAVESARASGRDDAIIMALFHPFDFVECDQDRGRMDLLEAEEILGWMDWQEDVEVITAQQAVYSQDCGSKRYRANREYLRMSMSRFVPTPKAMQWRRLRYLSFSEAVVRYFMLLAWAVFAYGSACLSAAVAGGLGVVYPEAGAYGFAVVVSMNLFWFAYVVWRRRGVYFRAAQVSLCLLSALAVSLMVWQGGAS